MVEPISGSHHKEDRSMRLDFYEADAVIIFGSAARDDSDSISDRDILLVGDSRPALVRIEQILECEGWSVAKFSWGQIRTMVARRSLFLAHIAHEGIILRDRDDKFQHLIGGFAPAYSYNDEIEVSKNMLAVVERIPDCPAGYLWASDVVAVAFRNLAISFLANHGIYKFSMREISASLLALGIIPKEAQRTIENLRKLKFCYRQKIQVPGLDFRFLQDVARVIDGVLSLDWHITRIPIENAFVDRFDFAHPYALSRAIEKVVILARPKNERSRSEFHAEMCAISRWVADPRRYIWLFSDRSKYVVDHHLDKLINLSVLV